MLTPSSRVQIILSHWHEDHVGGLSDVVRLLHEAGCPRPQVWKFAEGSEGGARDEEVERKLGGDVGEWVESAQAGQTLVQGGRIGRLREGQVMELRADEGSALALATLEVMHTPGHTSDSISLLLRSPSSPPALFTFDTVLGHGTAVFEDLGAYMLSLSKCLDMLSMADEGKVQLYPGHGEVVQDGVGKLKEYMKHRQEREDQVVGILSGQLGGEATAAG